MALRAVSRREQRGAALLAMLAVVVMGVSYLLVDRLHAASRFVAVDRAHNAKVLGRAKQALVGWMAINAATDNNPGRLPCPEAVNAIGTDSEGIAAPLVTPSTPNCATVGRLPWRTLGLDKLVDANAEPLWYVVSPGWALQNSSTLLTINSDSRGNMVIDGQAAPNEVVAMIIAPGPAMSVQAAAGCTARAQARAPAAPAMDPRDYIECFNAATPAFSTTGPATSFNDQVLRVTVGDLVPALEAAIAERMQREIAPALKAATYTSAQYSGIPAGVLLYPYPAPFTNPSTSNFQVGATLPNPPYPRPPYPDYTNPQGLLPFNQINAACTAPPPCTSLPVTGTVRVTGGVGFGGSIDSYACSSSATELLCAGQYREDGVDPTKDVRIEMAATFSDVAMGFRVLTSSPTPLSLTLAEARVNGGVGAWVTPSVTNMQFNMNDGTTYLPDGTLPPRGSVTIRFRATLPNIDAYAWGTFADFRIRINRAVFNDHALLDKTDATLGWFVRNEWYRNVYYAVARSNTPDGPNPEASLPWANCDSTNCLRFNDPATRNIRALLVLAGRQLPTQASRPSNTLLDYVENQNGDNGSRYEQRAPRMSKVAISSPFIAPWNDRGILVDWDPASPPNALQVFDPLNLTPPRVAALP